MDPTELLNSCAIGDLMRARLALVTLVLSNFQLFAKVASPQETPVCMYRLDAQTRSCKEKYSEVVVVTIGIPVASASISDSTLSFCQKLLKAQRLYKFEKFEKKTGFRFSNFTNFSH